MNMSVRFLGFACAALFAIPLCAQDTGKLVPATAPSTGTFVFNFTITAPTVPTNAVISCRGSASVFESGSGQNIQQDAHGIATLGSTGKWTCKASMPYSWTLATPASDSVTLSYSVEMDEGLEVTATNGTGTVVAPLTVQKVNQNLGTVTVPANGTTTTEAISSTI